MDYFDLYLHHRGKKQDSVFCINIGAMDGVLFDELIGYSTTYNFKGLYVEPIPYLFERLKSNLGEENLFENSAISSFNGEIEMLTIDQEAIDTGKIHKCFYGMSSVFPPKNGLASEGDKDTVEKYGKRIKVPCITFEELINRHSIKSFDVIKIDTEGHDFIIFNQIDLSKYDFDVIRLEWVNLSQEEQSALKLKLEQNKYVYDFIGQDIVCIKENIFSKINNLQLQPSMDTPSITLVTGLWDIKRSNLTEGWNRSFEDHYIKKLLELLKIPYNLIIYGEPELESIIYEHRTTENTQFIPRSQEWFKNEFFDKIQSIRNNPEWYNQAGWLKDSTQASLEMYNPLVMSKMFLLNDAKLMDQFNSDHIYWIDAGLTSTVHVGYFTHDRVLDKLINKAHKFTFVAFPYNANTEIHGFTYPDINNFASSDVKLVARGGFFGGPKETVSEANSLYYDLLKFSLNKGYMGTEESIFSIMIYKYSDLFNFAKIKENGLISSFFEDVKNDKLVLHSTSPKNSTQPIDYRKVGLYVIGFNSPDQFEKLCESFVKYDKDFISFTEKFLLNNSLDRSTDSKYNELCGKYGFEQIKKDNLGICGGRQFIAEHFDNSTDLDYYIFYEDDMVFYEGGNTTCRNGMIRKVDNLYKKSLEIIHNENLDFLKLNFSEFFGDNTKQWAWHNVPATLRKELFPDAPIKTGDGLRQAPFSKFENIKSHKGLPYATGEIYYCNWPQIVSREGNKKMFLDTKWEFPYEQTWMSYIYQETLKGNIKPGILLASPTEHHRFDHYSREERREN